MATPNNYRVAAAFQGEKDPQQDAIIAWLGNLPKDARGGIKRSVMKYHLTRALLMYMQSGADTSTSLINAPAPSSALSQKDGATKPQPPSAVVDSARNSPVTPVGNPPVSIPAPVEPQIPVLHDEVKPKGLNNALRKKIAGSMNGN